MNQTGRDVVEKLAQKKQPSSQISRKTQPSASCAAKHQGQTYLSASTRQEMSADKEQHHCFRLALAGMLFPSEGWKLDQCAGLAAREVELTCLEATAWAGIES